MSDKSEGPGWWIASDGKWYPPELHPSAREAAKPWPSAPAVPDAGTDWGQDQPDKAALVGPQFPDLFQKALDGSHLADNVSVNYSGDDERTSMEQTRVERRSEPRSPVGSMAGASAGGVGSDSGAIGATFGSSAAKRRWRKSG